MPLRRTQRSNGRQRPRWKDGSHVDVESTHANESRCNQIALEPNRQTESLVTTPQLLKRSHENNVSTRDRLAGTGADARIEESAVMGKVRLALRPYGRKNRLRFRQCPIRGIRLSRTEELESPPPALGSVQARLTAHSRSTRTSDPALTLRIYAHAMPERKTDLSFAEFGGS